MLAVEAYGVKKVYRVKTVSGYFGEAPGSMLYGLYKALTAKWRTVEALKGVSLRIEKGAFYGVLGPNGSGKTTLLEILATLRVPTEGEVYVLGHDVVREKEKVVELVSYIPGVLTGGAWVEPKLTGRQNLVMMAKVYGARREEVDEVLSLVGLEDEADRPAGTYSSGMYARLVLALGLLRRAQIMIMDEPFAGVSYETRLELKGYLERINREHGVTIVYSTHDLEEAEELCDKVSLMHKGRVIAEGTPRELVKSIGRGEVIVLDILKAGEAVISRLGGLSGVIDLNYSSLNLEEGLYRVRVRVEDSREVLPGIVEVVVREGCFIRHVEVRRPTLEDVFLHYVKRGA